MKTHSDEIDSAPSSWSRKTFAKASTSMSRWLQLAFLRKPFTRCTNWVESPLWSLRGRQHIHLLWTPRDRERGSTDNFHLKKAWHKLHVLLFPLTVVSVKVGCLKALSWLVLKSLKSLRKRASFQQSTQECFGIDETEIVKQRCPFSSHRTYHLLNLQSNALFSLPIPSSNDADEENWRQESVVDVELKNTSFSRTSWEFMKDSKGDKHWVQQ